MKMLLILGGMALIVYSIRHQIDFVDARDVPQFNWRSPPSPRVFRSDKQKARDAAYDAAQAKAAKAKAAATKPSKSANGEPIALIKAVAKDYGVPGGALYGIWSKESSRRLQGWGDSKGWLLAADMVKDGSTCVNEYGKAKCEKHWRALKAICGQTRRDGTKVCDPYEVRVSYALAMGPMQHMPGEIVEFDKSGQAQWGSRARDFDGDGVIDPHDLDDAMAMSAAFLKKYHQQYGSWQKAVNRYYGSQTAGYMEGTTEGRKGVVDYWKIWCSSYENCTNSQQLFASND